MKNAKMKPMLYILLAAIVLLCGCNTSDEQQVSPNAEKVISAIMNTPNPDLFSEAMITSIGVSAESQTAQDSQREAILANWETTVGDCFSEGSLESFLNSSAAMIYHSNALILGTETEVLSLSLVSRDEHCETVSVELSANGEVKHITVFLRMNPDGLFYEVEIREET